jgi:hypothetical protein
MLLLFVLAIPVAPILLNRPLVPPQQLDGLRILWLERFGPKLGDEPLLADGPRGLARGPSCLSLHSDGPVSISS